MAVASALLALAAVAGCGGSEGVAAGASVNVYVAARLCPGAREALSRDEGRVGEVEVRALCLAPVVGGGRIDLAAQGANARRASQDSTTVAFVEAKGKPARFAKPIVAAAGIAFVEATSGEAAMERVLKAIAAAGSGSLRKQVLEALG
ncbi:MAG: hypothetical protein JST31_02545 [Actinobacteria bacterium]|nr:hypothetical protein [Actinomycetota bacterium]